MGETLLPKRYRQTCQAYPNGGGAHAVSRGNLGRTASLVAASALLIDYVLTVAVSVAAGIDAITSAFLGLKPHAVFISLGLVAVLAVINLRGVKESGTIFAIPTYGFIAVVFLMIGWGFWRLLFGQAPVAESAPFGITASHQAAGVAVLVLALRAFAQGCTALTGVEAVSYESVGLLSARTGWAAALGEDNNDLYDGGVVVGA